MNSATAYANFKTPPDPPSPTFGYISLKGRFLLSINDVPEIREIFSWAEIEPVRTTYSIAGKGQSIPAAELLIRGNVR